MDNTERNLFERLKRDKVVRQLTEKYCGSSLFDDVFGVAHSESLHTNFFLWMLRQGATIPLFFKDFVKLICKKARACSYNYGDVGKISNMISQTNIEVSFRNDGISKEVKTSYRIKQEQKNPRVDCVIDFDIKGENSSNSLKIIVENKTFSKEHSDQTKIYYSYFSGDDDYVKNNIPEIDFYKKNRNHRNERVYKKSQGELQLFVFLHPLDYDLGDYASKRCEYFIPISYQEILHDLILKYKDQFVPEYRGFVEDYINILIKPNKKNHKVMAMHPEDNESLRKFAETYLPLFRLAVKALDVSSGKSSDDGETYAAIQQILCGIDQLGGKRKKYDLKIRDYKEWSSLKMWEVAHHIVKYIGSSIPFAELISLFPHSKWILCKTEYDNRKLETKEIEERFKARWDKIGDFYVSKEWTADRFNDFVNRIESRFSQIKVTLI